MVPRQRHAIVAHLPHARRRRIVVAQRAVHSAAVDGQQSRPRGGPVHQLADARHKRDDVAILQQRRRRCAHRVDLRHVRLERLAHLLHHVRHRRTPREVEDLAVGGEDEDARAEELLPHELHELVRAVEMVPFAHRQLQPRQRGARAAARLVRPVRGRAKLGDVVHRDGTDLDLERLRADEHGRVQRAVAVGLRARDVVLERARQRRPQPVDLAEGMVAQVVVRVLVLVLGARVDHDAQRHQVVHLLGRAAVAQQLLPRRVARLGAPRHGDLLDALLEPRILAQPLRELGGGVGEEVLVALELRVDERVNLLVLGRAEVLEGQVGELRLELPARRHKLAQVTSSCRAVVDRGGGPRVVSSGGLAREGGRWERLGSEQVVGYEVGSGLRRPHTTCRGGARAARKSRGSLARSTRAWAAASPRACACCAAGLPASRRQSANLRPSPQTSSEGSPPARRPCRAAWRARPFA
mmetsp:Transcript_45476/g.126132  ORF Transcript_45476/g.126132 Transcript_45476/m.126132 type:complete len:468 (-) Transcript_45476:558-1961(-)